MTYELFQSKVNAMITRSGANVHVHFHNDIEKGRFFASCGDGMTIIGNSVNPSVTVRWGDGHNAIARI